MEYANIDELLSIIDENKIVREQIPIKNHTYTCGYCTPKDKVIVLNSHNSILTDYYTLSHEITHIYYDFNKGLYLPEEIIEDISQRQFLLVSEYHRAIKKKCM